jgi:hypothetical protein
MNKATQHTKQGMNRKKMLGHYYSMVLQGLTTSIIIYNITGTVSVSPVIVLKFVFWFKVIAFWFLFSK